MNALLATGNLYGRTWRVHRAVAEGVGTYASSYLEWSYEGEAEVRQARNWAPGEDGKVWDRASTNPEVAAEVAHVEAAWVADGGPERARRDADQRRAQAARLRAEAERSGRRCYLRFGHLPESGASFNHRDGRHEAGVSVYAAWYLPGNRYVIDLRGLDVISSAFIIDGDEPVYEVTGTELETTGADGEPLLAAAQGSRVRPARIQTTI